MFGPSSKDSSPQKSVAAGGLSVPKIVIKSADEISELQYETLPHRRNWAVMVLALTYLNQSSLTKETAKGIIGRLDSGAANIVCCYPHTIPSSLKQLYTAGQLTELLRVGLEAAIEVNDPVIRPRLMVDLFLSRPDVAFALELWVRSLMIETAQVMVPQHSLEFLGNQQQLLKDYSCGFEYKLLKIASYCLKIKIEVIYIHESGEHTEIYSQGTCASELTVIRRNDRVEFKITQWVGTNLHHLNRATISTDSSAKETLRHMIGKEKEPMGDFLEPPPTHTERSKQLVRSRDRSQYQINERNATPQIREKSSSKNCPKCGQTRRIEQKFCICRKNNTRTPTPKNP